MPSRAKAGAAPSTTGTFWAASSNSSSNSNSNSNNNNISNNSSNNNNNNKVGCAYPCTRGGGASRDGFGGNS